MSCRERWLWILVLSAMSCSRADPPAETSTAISARPSGLAVAETRSELRARALLLANRAGVATPLRMVAVAAADHQAAEAAISGAVLDDHAPVYVVQMSGATFTAPRHPPGVEAPTGSVLTVTFDAKTMDVLDVGYDGEAPDLGRVDSFEPVDLTGTL